MPIIVVLPLAKKAGIQPTLKWPHIIGGHATVQVDS
jgi:hypothetical protein